MIGGRMDAGGAVAGSISQVNRTPAAKYRAASAGSPSVLLGERIRRPIGGNGGNGHLGQFAPGKRSRLIKHTSGMRTWPGRTRNVPPRPEQCPVWPGRTNLQR